MVAKNAGFCFGVRRATDLVEELIKNKDSGLVCTLGQLIHNEEYIRYLESNGVREISVEDIDGLYNKDARN